MARLSILTREEIQSLYSIPKLDEEERAFLFTLDDDDRAYLQTLDNDTPRMVNYILQLGFYRAVSYLFQFSFQSRRADVGYILKQYFPDAPFPKKNLSKKHHYHNRTEVMRKYGLCDTDSDVEVRLLKEAKALARRHVLSRFVLQELLAYCLDKGVIRPAYSALQNIVSAALNYERNRLTNKLYTHAGKELRDQIDQLLIHSDLFYRLTIIKKDQKNFNTAEIKRSVAKQQMIIGIFEKSQALMSQLGISEQNILYYANLAEFYTVQKLRQLRNKNQTRLYLLCYAHRRLLKINDYLVTSVIYKCNGYKDDADEHQRAKIDIAEAVDNQCRQQACKVLAININETIPDTRIREKAFKIIPEADYRQFVRDFRKPNLSRDYHRWEYYGKQSMAIKKNMRPLFTVLDFSCAKKGMIAAATFLKHHLTKNRSFLSYRYHEVPLGFFPKSTRKFLTYKARDSNGRLIRKIDGDRYEFMVYLQLCKGLCDGTVFVKNSNSYRSLEDELIDNEYWAKHKKDILAKLNMPLLSMDVNELLDQLQSNLERKYIDVNQRILRGENTSLKTRTNKKGELSGWTLPYTRLDDGVNNPFYEQLPVTNVGDILRFAADSTGFLEAFSHLQPKYAKTAADPEVLSACIVADATGIETKRMKAISDVTEKDLDNVNKNFIRCETLAQGSQKIMSRTAALPIFDEYNLSDYGVHASVDGQKIITRYNTIKSRHSRKYFGMIKGIVVLSLNANHMPLCLKVIGAKEHESHFLLDIVESNTSDVEIASVSGDMHSINRVNFALLHMFGYRFMPRFTQLSAKTETSLVGFGHTSEYEQSPIKPCKKAEKSLIIDEWDNVLRILASLALKKTTQSQIVRKLSSHRKNPTLRALIALDEIIRSEYILDYIDIKEIRMVVQSSLCRVESYHQLSSTVAKVSGGRMLSGKNEIELDINAEAIRLIANAVIFYNATLLSSLYEHYRAIDPKKAKVIARLSPVAWQHINFIGKYEFYSRGKPIDIQSLIEFLLAHSEIDISAGSQ